MSTVAFFPHRPNAMTEEQKTQAKVDVAELESQHKELEERRAAVKRARSTVTAFPSKSHCTIHAFFEPSSESHAPAA